MNNFKMSDLNGGNGEKKKIDFPPEKTFSLDVNN